MHRQRRKYHPANLDSFLEPYLCLITQWISVLHENSDNIVSVSDYTGAKSFLLSEGSEFSGSTFSLIRVGQGNTIEEVIAFGGADTIYSLIGGNQSSRRLLND